MNYYYSFPVVKGVQAGKAYYIAMVPLKMLKRLFVYDDEYVLPEHRAQRRLNEARIPEIKKYILDNKQSYVFSALAASIDGDFRFRMVENDIGYLEVSLDAKFLINDGQHRKAAILAALEDDSSIENETISVVFYEDAGLRRSQQMFTDLNKHALRTSNSLATLYDSRDELAMATKSLIDAIPFLRKYTDKERDILGVNSSKLFTLNTIYKANQRILHSKKCKEGDGSFLVLFWSLVIKHMPQWRELQNKEIAKRDLRENYIVTLAITITALGKLGGVFYDHRNIQMENYLEKLERIDWSRDNCDWIGRTIKENGKVMTGEEAINLTFEKIKELIELNEV